MKHYATTASLFAATAFFACAVPSLAQSTNNSATNRTARGPQGPRVTSPEVSADRKITFRILAPKAESVKLGAGDIQGLSQDATTLTRGTNGVWELTVGPVAAGA